MERPYYLKTFYRGLLDEAFVHQTAEQSETDIIDNFEKEMRPFTNKELAAFITQNYCDKRTVGRTYGGEFCNIPYDVLKMRNFGGSYNPKKWEIELEDQGWSLDHIKCQSYGNRKIVTCTFYRWYRGRCQQINQKYSSLGEDFKSKLTQELKEKCQKDE